MKKLTIRGKEHAQVSLYGGDHEGKPLAISLGLSNNFECSIKFKFTQSVSTDHVFYARENSLFEFYDFSRFPREGEREREIVCREIMSKER
jgi:hypothetical protein